MGVVGGPGRQRNNNKRTKHHRKIKNTNNHPRLAMWLGWVLPQHTHAQPTRIRAPPPTASKKWGRKEKKKKRGESERAYGENAVRARRGLVLGGLGNRPRGVAEEEQVQRLLLCGRKVRRQVLQHNVAFAILPGEAQTKTG